VAEKVVKQVKQDPTIISFQSTKPEIAYYQHMAEMFHKAGYIKENNVDELARYALTVLASQFLDLESKILDSQIKKAV